MIKKVVFFSYTLLITFVVCSQMACGIYSFSGTSVHPDVKTVYIEDFENLASNVEPTLTQTLVEKMKNKFTSEARLNIANNSGDVEFNGAVLNYFVEPAASGGDDKAALSRLNIVVRIEYLNNITDETWSQTFQQYETFSQDANLSDVEAGLIDTITERMVNDIFTKAFSNW